MALLEVDVPVTGLLPLGAENKEKNDGMGAENWEKALKSVC